MIEAKEKSTAGAVPVGEGVVLDGRLAIWHEESKRLALSDVHYGYEVSLRAGGGLWPLWSMATIEDRFGELLDDYHPERIVLAGDIVDSGAAGREALAWSESVRERCGELGAAQK